ncbi:hypothetical protein Clacol_001402 [Clathrus columnatus]|uniref:Dynein light intermediate chain n=1 Tax=Clathrus columnatus TaxID=1419009 RepID=A0AAV4ZY72_9AGAM|nr:hypothetical protein Clacol_001402 [Clathrus columnatus]
MSAIDPPETEHVENLWSSILDSVSSTRSIPSKQILILGDRVSGKSTIAAALLGKQLDNLKPDKSDFAYPRTTFSLYRSMLFTILSMLSASLSSFSHIITTYIGHNYVGLDTPMLWLTWIETWGKGDGTREAEIAREESRERLQSYLQHYTESSTSGEASLPGASTLSGTVLPLGQGVLTHNSTGIPIIVVCTKADLIDEGHDAVGGAGSMGGMVKGKGGEWEERTDGIMQVLRTICMKYGAGLFYTTQQPQTLSTLRQYALHFLFAPPTPSAVLGSPEVPLPTRNIFPFNQRPNILDRDRVLVPAGWDSWGKIAVLREGFDAKGWGEAWERDIDGDESGAKEMFKAIVGGDQGPRPRTLPPLVQPIPEQQFLAMHYESIAKSSDRDPRQTFRAPNDPSNVTGAGVVGPLGSSSFNLPSVEKALVEMEGNSGSRTTNVSRPNVTSGRPAATLSTNGTSSIHTHSRPQISPNLSNSQSNSTPTQHEVLQNFFNSLLSSRDRSSTGASATANPNPPPSNTTNGQDR